MIKGIKKNYRIINIIIFIFCIYVFSFPLVSKLLGMISPKLTLCSFLAITGKPCPLCGGTRFIKGLPNAIINKNIYYMFNFFGIFIIIMFLELTFRTINLFRKNFSEKFKNIDIIVHFILILALATYEIIYVVNI